MSNTRAEMYAMLEAFQAEVPAHYSICSLQAPKNDCVTFIRSEKYIDQLHALVRKGVSNVTVIAPPNLVLPAVSGVSYYLTEHVDMLFTLFNNHARKGYDPKPFDRISSSVILDEGAVIGAEGVSIAKYKDERVLFRHYGRVVLEDNVYVGANAVIQRGRIDDTVVGRGSMISSLCVVGANTIIGQNCTITIQAGISGSARIGDRCWLGIGAKVRDYVSICDDVFVGMGSIVTKDITEPGIYAGNPCRFLRPHEST
jgi:carbonic anhydrase/acetyltransferase-like protein (isoleucine patch superfamily)